MSNKKKNAVKAAILGAAICVSASHAAASELLTVKPLGSAQSIRSNVLGGKMTPGTATESNTYAAEGSKGGEGKCGEGKCGEGKCGEGTKDSSSSSSDKGGVGKCGEGKCGDGGKH